MGRSQSQQSCARAELWLQERISVEMGADGFDLSAALRILLGYWICECVLQSAAAPRGVTELMRHVESRLCTQSGARNFEPLRYDARLLLLAHHILSVCGCRTYGIETFAQQLAAAVKERLIVPLRCVGEALLLARLGYGEYPPIPTLEPRDAGTDAFCLLRGDEEQILSVCQNIGAATHFGSQRLRATAGVRSYLGHMLPIILLQSMREYNLELGALVLRTIRYLRITGNQALSVAISFLMDQQLVDGRFGHFGIEAAKISELEGKDSSQVANELYLPITVSCLWTLAEVGKVNLFSLPRPQWANRGRNCC